MPFTTNEIRSGNKVEIDGEPFVIVGNEFVKPGKGQAFNRIKMENIKTGRVVERTYKSGEKFEEADIEEKTMTYLYAEGDGAVFMDGETFDQISIDAELVTPIKHWLMEDVLYQIILFKGIPIKISPPFTLDMVIEETSPGVRGDTSGKALKPAKTSTGAEVYVPLFISQGEKIKVDTRTGDYVSRSNT